MMLNNAASMDNHTMLTSLLLQACNQRTRDTLRGLIKTSIGTKVGPVLGQAGKLRTHAGCLIQKTLDVGQVLSGIIASVELNRGCSEMHAALLSLQLM